MKKAIEPTVGIHLKRLDLQSIKLRLVGTAPLICHAWSAKAKRQMLEKQMKKASSGKTAKDPVADFRESLYRLPDGKGFGFPAIAFKAAAVDAANIVELKKTEMRGCFHLLGELVKIEAPELKAPLTECDAEYWDAITAEREHGASMRSDMVRIGMGVADIRFRAQFVKWSVELTLQFNKAAISAEQLVNLFNVAGFAVGVGEHRPQRDGSSGLFRVE